MSQEDSNRASKSLFLPKELRRTTGRAYSTEELESILSTIQMKLNNALYGCDDDNFTLAAINFTGAEMRFIQKALGYE